MCDKLEGALKFFEAKLQAYVAKYDRSPSAELFVVWLQEAREKYAGASSDGKASGGNENDSYRSSI